jgi:hypothetical protein
MFPLRKAIQASDTERLKRLSRLYRGKTYAHKKNEKVSTWQPKYFRESLDQDVRSCRSCKLPLQLLIERFEEIVRKCSDCGADVRLEGGGGGE